MRSPSFPLFTVHMSFCPLTAYKSLSQKAFPVQLAFWSWCFPVAAVILTRTGVREVMDSATTAESRAAVSQPRKAFHRGEGCDSERRRQPSMLFCQWGLMEARSRITNQTIWLKSDGDKAMHCLKVSRIKWQLPKREAS